MLLVEDNGGGMNLDTIRRCISFGYSDKSKVSNTIGQYGNGFKTSTMRLGADAIVFSRSLGKDGKRPTQSIGMLSYTFLRSTGKDDIVVPILDYEKRGQNWDNMTHSSPSDRVTKLETILQWSPYSNEAELLQQFNLVENQGTRIIIYNLWENDEGELELDFDTDSHDIQLSGVNRDESKTEMAKKYPNSTKFLTYRHSFRSYTSILYLRLPRGFRIILRGKDVEHHNITNDMMLVKNTTYRPVAADGALKVSNMLADVTMGFVKDAENHLDVQGFNVYHKNRLIKPFWRVWNSAGSDGRGVIGVLEANFVEPAHDKQDFENTPVLQKLHGRLLHMQKEYWKSNCHKIGYAPRTKRARAESEEDSPKSSSRKTSVSLSKEKMHESKRKYNGQPEQPLNEKFEQCVTSSKSKKVNPTCNGKRSAPDLDENGQVKDRLMSIKKEKSIMIENQSNIIHLSSSDAVMLVENDHLKERLKNMEEDLQLEREKSRTLEAELTHHNKELDTIISVFQEERGRRDNEEANLRRKLAEERNRRDDEEANLRRKIAAASCTIEELRRKVTLLEKTNP